MKPGIAANLFLFFLLAHLAVAQNFSVGVKGGFPFTYSTNKTSSVNVTYDSSTHGFIAGGMAELGLPLGLSVEGDFLYHPFNVRLSSPITVATDINHAVFEIPIVGKLRLGKGLARPYVEAGPEFRTSLSSLSLSHDGFVVGGGIEFKLLVLKLSPEIRYTHWANSTFAPANGNQAAILLGVYF